MKRAFSLLLALCLILSLLPVGTLAAQDSANVTKYVEVTQLTADKDYILAAVNEDGSVSAITVGSSGNVSATKLTVSNASVETDDTALVWKYASNGNFTNDGKMLYPTSGGSVMAYNRNRAIKFADGKLSFDTTSDGTFYITFDGTTFKTSNDVASAAQFRVFERRDYVNLPEDCAHANLTAHAAKAATCTETGNEAYWECGDCGTIFSDAECQSTAIASDLFIPALGHDWGEWTAYNEYYNIRYCNRCGASQPDLPIFSSGSCGKNLTWTLYDNGLLVITGSGAMTSHPWSADRVHSIVFEGDVMSVCDSAFESCTGLTEVIIPDSVTNIGSFAFSGCSSLTAITIPDSISSISSSTFSGCSSLTDVEIPDSVRSIGISVFSDCISLTSVALPDSVTSISSSAFKNCTSLTEITIPDNVTSIGRNAFSDCTGLTEIKLPSRLRYIYEYAFSDCTGLKSITIPGSLYGNGLYSYAFSYCTSLNEVHGLENRSVPECCFSGCTALTEITVGSVESNAFSGCTSLQQAEVRGSVGSYAFRGCTSLQQAEVRGSVDSYAFKDCQSLQQAEVGGDIGEYAFNGCEALTRLTMTGGSTIGTYGVANCPALTTAALPTSLTTVEGNAFRNDTALTDVHYAGTQAQWDAITIRDSGNDPLKNANIHSDCQHPETELRNAREATCTESGYTGDEVCLLCGVTVQYGQTIPGGHDWDDGVITKAATCTEDGEMTYTCRNDASHTRTETIAALGHTWGEWIVTKEVSDTEAGEKMRTCSVCGEQETQEIPIPGTVSEVSVTPSTDHPEVSAAIHVGDTLTIKVTNGSSGAAYDFTATLSSSGIARIQGSTTVNIASGAEGTFTVEGIADGTVDITISNNNSYGDQYSRKATIHLTVGSGVAPTTEPTTPPEPMTYTLTGELENGKEYLIVSDFNDGEAYALTNQSGTMGTTAVTIEDGKIITSATDLVWTATGNGYGFSLSNGSYYLEAYASSVGINSSQQYSDRGWEYHNRQLTLASSHGSYYTVYYENNAFTASYSSEIGSQKVYLFVQGDGTPVMPCEHSSTAVTGERPATCSEPGYTGDTVCQDCGEILQAGEVIPTLPHTWSAWVTVIPASESETGVEVRVCRVCKAIETRSIPRTGPFSDVPANAYYHDSVLWAYSHEPQITSGYADGSFRPDQVCTRAQVVTFIWRAAGEPEPKLKVNPFRDVSESAYYYKAVLWAVENGVTTGNAGGTFNPDGECTRAQVVTFLWRAAGEPEPTSTTNPFRDVSASAYYYKAVLWALETCVTTGNTSTTFNPNGKCTRAHVVTFLYRANT